MQTLRLVRVAAEAEKLRWQRRARRLAVRVGLAAIAACFAVAAIVVLHVLGYLALRLAFEPLIAAAIVLAGDILLALVFGIAATRRGPDSIEREALEVRQQALAKLGETMALWSLLRAIGAIFGKRGVYGMTLAALMAQFLAR